MRRGSTTLQTIGTRVIELSIYILSIYLSIYLSIDLSISIYRSIYIYLSRTIYTLVGNTKQRGVGDLFKRGLMAAFMLQMLELTPFFFNGGSDPRNVKIQVGGIECNIVL